MKKLITIPFLIFLFFASVCEAQYTDLHDFNDTGLVNNTNGYNPDGNIIIAGNVLYGVASHSGASGLGTIFSVHIDGSHYKDLFDFTGVNGSFPEGTLTLVGHKLYGYTNTGGAHGMGVIFSIDTAGGGYTALWSFTNATGADPFLGSLVFYKDKLYGMAQLGGANGDGAVFAYDTITNTYADIFDFNGTNGKKPAGSVVMFNDKLYGTTFQGGASSFGNVFSMDTSGGHYKDLLDFTGAANGSYPEEGRLQLSGNVLYGTTDAGGAHNQGCIYSIDTNGNNYNLLYSFTSGDPYGSVSLIGNLLYGMTYVGGAYNDGTIFSMDTNGAGYSTLLLFNGTNGKNPYGDITIAGNGILYGMTKIGGANNYGVLFSEDVCNLFTSTSADSGITTCYGSNTGVAYATGASGGPTPYTYLWSPGGITSSRASGLSAGTYTLTVTDYSGCSSTSSVTITQPALLAVTVTNTDIQCNGGATGSATATPSGGIGAYTYNWTPSGGTGATANSLTAGTYVITVTDNNGCTATANAIITQPTVLTLTSANTPVKCNGGATGTATATAGGGTPAYSYAWTPLGGTGVTANGLTIGTYTVTLTDANGCSMTASTTITQPVAITIAQGIIPTSSPILCNGTAWTTISGGTSPYSYLWSPGGGTTDTIKALCNGNYCCTITDNNGCIDSSCINVVTGIPMLSNSTSFKIFPDPNSGYFTISGLTKGLVIELYNYTGQKISAQKANDATMQFDIADKANGIYLIRIISKDGNLSEQVKIIKTN